MKAVNKSKVMTHAWQLVKKTGVSLAAALRQAWQECKLAAVQALLKTGFVWVTFRKVDGTITTRLATRNSELVPDPDKPKGSAMAKPSVVCFYSETDHAWRSFKAENLLSFKAA